jgi:UDPglucose 6-dehydrogenase
VSRIVVIGAGYVGLTSAACFAHLGHEVRCVDIDQIRIEKIQSGRLPIIEEGLLELVNNGVKSGLLSFSHDVSVVDSFAEMVFLCVPTPQAIDGSADLSFVQKAARHISELMPKDCIVVNKSTVPVGSTKIVELEIQRNDVKVVSNPEFLREGTAVLDFLNPDRIIVGAENFEAAEMVAKLYERLGAPVLITDPASAETIKYASNAFLATKISFVNAVAAICEGVGADVSDVVKGLGFDNRIGKSFLQPGPGWGGSCLPKDTAALIKIGEQNGYDFDLLRGVVAVNEQQFERVVNKTKLALSGELDGKNIAVWGLTFKANTGDMRDSPAIRIINILMNLGAKVSAFDPSVQSIDSELDGVSICQSSLEAVKNAEVLLVLTEWHDFSIVSPNEVRALMLSPNVVDARNLLNKPNWIEAGFNYQGIGR